MGIAFDFVFTGINAQDAWCGFKEAVVNQSSFFESLLSLGLGGIGVYGKRALKKGSYFFHIDTRTTGDGFPRSQVLNGKRYGRWVEGDVSCDLATKQDIQNTGEQIKDRQRGQAQVPGIDPVVKYIHPVEVGLISFEDLTNF